MSFARSSRTSSSSSSPIYNADGNEKFSVENRTAQYGPITGVGVRENDQGLDLNRDYIKLDAPETNALVRLYTAWNPLLTADLHTTDGSYHGYHLTYSVPLNPSSDPALLAYHRQQLMPAIASAMLKQHNYRTEYYGNFTPTYAGPRPTGGGRGPASAQATTAATQPASRPTAWYAFSPPRASARTTWACRNRLTILSEAYSPSTSKPASKSPKPSSRKPKQPAAHAHEMQQTADKADAEMIQKARNGTLQIGLGYEPKATAGGISEILEAEVKREPNPISKHDMTIALMDKLTPRRVYNYDDSPAPTSSVTAARAYLFRNEPAMQPIIAKLRPHGITVETLSAPLETQVDAFSITSVTQLGNFQNHRETTLTGTFQKQTINFPAGTIAIRTDQHLGLLAAYMLEPESDDGFTRWNFLDAQLGAGKTHPVYKLMTELKTPTHPMGDEGE